MNCRFCKTPLHHEFIDLVNAPPSNSFLRPEQASEPETYYPLKLFVCHECHLVQIDVYKASQDIFNQDYVYFSSFSSSWVEHARRYTEMITQKLRLDAKSLVIEIACNDGYLLQFFKKRGIPCLGIEPSLATAEAARKMGIEVMTEFFGIELGKKLCGENRRADLLVGNNVLAHVPNINDFISGIYEVLAPKGVVTMEFPHLLRLITENQFDTIYHEHFSYLSFHTVDRIFSEHGLDIFDVEELPTHGGSLRIYAMRSSVSPGKTTAVKQLLEIEKDEGMFDMDYYQGFQGHADQVKYDLLRFLLEQKKNGKTVAAYGAAAKGNTLLNYCGVKQDLIAFAVDASKHKQGLLMPGSHIPVLPVSAIYEKRPDFILILPWNIKDEIMEQLAFVREWKSRFVWAIPKLEIV